MRKNSGKMIVAFFMSIFFHVVMQCATSYQAKDDQFKPEIKTMKEVPMSVSTQPHVHKFSLENGMTVLVRGVPTIPKVSLQIWYNVGSKDEEAGERGIAHLIEHMIFKGTDTLSESDINMVAHKLSGQINAFTSYDYTGYLFNFPEHNWREVLPIMADCMQNVRFDDQMLNSEMKAVIQELKMYRDQYKRSLMKKLLGAIFEGHPYHHPTIGYKQDLWNVKGQDLKNFYKKHYCPNNATLVIVGDVDENEVHKLAKEYFESIAPNPEYVKQEHFLENDIISKSVTLYRDVQQPTVMLAFRVPGARQKSDYPLQMLEWVLGKGKSSRLHKKLVEELQIATAIGTGFWDLFDSGVFFMIIEPKDENDIAQIEEVVMQELDSLAQSGVQADEFSRALKKTKMAQYSLLEDIEDQAYQIGGAYLATGDAEYVFSGLEVPEAQLMERMNTFVANYFRPSVMHKGYILSLPEREKEQWVVLQKESDLEDERILSAHIRKTPVEPPVYADTISAKEPKQFDFPKANEAQLANGIKLLYHHNSNTPKIDLLLKLKSKYYYDPDDKQGLYNFVANMLSEGTRNYTSAELAEAIESRGMSFDAFPGGVSMSMLTQDISFGLEILKEIITESTFDEKAIEKVRGQILSEIKHFWDEPRYFSSQVLREQVYKGHPYSKNDIGTAESIRSITREDLLSFYKKYISPHGAKLAIVGDLSGYNIPQIVEEHLGSWQGPEVEDIDFPVLHQIKPELVKYPINRDQIIVSFARLSIPRVHPDYDKYLLFDQVFGGGVLHSMSSRLFQLREETGLFYTIRGTSIAGSNEQPGMFQVKTIVSADRLAEAEKAIKQTIDSTVDSITQTELDEGRNAIINSLANNFASNSSIAAAFLYLDRYNLPSDYFDTRPLQLAQVTLDDVKKVMKPVANSNELLTLEIGRV